MCFGREIETVKLINPSCWGKNKSSVQTDMKEGQITLLECHNPHVNLAASVGPGKLSFIKWVRADLCSDLSRSRLCGHCTAHSKIMMNLLHFSLAGRLHTALCHLHRERRGESETSLIQYSPCKCCGNSLYCLSCQAQLNWVDSEKKKMMGEQLDSMRESIICLNCLTVCSRFTMMHNQH